MLTFTLNGTPQSVDVADDTPLLWVIRDVVGLTGTKFGCGEGQCRACTVLVNGSCTAACLTSVGDLENADITTIEGLADGDHLHPVQAVFLEEGAFQCGYCTAGMIMGVVGTLHGNPRASATEVRTEMQKHICRCCSYTKYQKAIDRVVAQTGKGAA